MQRVHDRLQPLHFPNRRSVKPETPVQLDRHRRTAAQPFREFPQVGRAPQAAPQNEWQHDNAGANKR